MDALVAARTACRPGDQGTTVFAVSLGLAAVNLASALDPAQAARPGM